jgi:anaerobic selenocysteine-containing dehydrogenase
VHYHACPLCEATCGLEIRTRGREVVGIRGDAEDVFSRGFICPKGYAVKELDADPDRLRTPLIKRNGRFEAASWDEAFAEVDRRLMPIVTAKGRDAAAVASVIRARTACGSRSATRSSCAVSDRRHLLGEHCRPDAETGRGRLMFGTVLSVPVPDLDRAAYLLVLGAVRGSRMGA